MTDATLRQLPLRARHEAAGARFAPFAGWDMPVRFTQVRDEHLAVRGAVGLFDVSHMGEVFVRGPGAVGAVNRLVTNDVRTLEDGQALYTVMCNEDGGIVDDLIVYRLGPEELLLCVNAGNIAKDAAWIASTIGDEADVSNESDRWCQLAIQGPNAMALVGDVFGDDVCGIRPFHAAYVTVDGSDILVARTGYTGEDGVELYVPSEAIETVYDRIVDAGAQHGLVSVGLAARDSLRLEARLLLYGNDIDESTNPIEAGLGWVVKLDKGPFVGSEAIARVKEEGPTRRLRGLVLEGNAMLRPDMPVFVGDVEVGRTTSGSIAYALDDKRIALAWVDAAHTDVTEVEVQIRDRRWPASVTTKPFYRRSRT